MSSGRGPGLGELPGRPGDKPMVIYLLRKRQAGEVARLAGEEKSRVSGLTS